MSRRSHLYYSNRTEELLGALVENLATERRAGGRSPLEPSTLVVPNRSLETYLRFGIARRLGIAANLDVRFLRSFLADLLAVALPDVRLLDATAIEGLLLAIFQEPSRLGRGELAPVGTYLDADHGEARDLRAVQLAAELGRLYAEYSYSRPDMLAAWGRGRTTLGDEELAPVERWQRALWQLAERAAAARAREARQRWLTLPALLDVLAKTDLALPRSIHFFGVSYMARAYHDLLGLLGRWTDLHLYTLNPCCEFWEDLQTSGERGPLPSRAARLEPGQLLDEDPFRFDAGADPPALRHWGRPGRENVRLLNELCDFDFVARFAEPEGGTLLADLQRDILHRRAGQAGDPDRYDGDQSITLLACPSVRREAEIIASEILALLEAAQHDGRPLRLGEIAIVLPAASAPLYQTHLAAVLGESHDIPHSIIDLGVGEDNRMADGLALLLGLPLGRFTRQEVLRVVTHPAIRGRFPAADSRLLVDWCERLGIFHGADRTDHEGTYLERDIVNWDQGLKRLALGSFMVGRRSGDARELSLGGERYSPEELGREESERAAELCALVRSLVADARYLRAERLTLAEWVARLHALVDAYLVPADESDERALLGCRAAIEALARFPLGAAPVSYRIVRELCAAELAAQRAGRGPHRADGVAISTFLPMRTIPSRVIFIAGLGEGQFPAAETRSAFDLRQARRRAGDVSPREQDRYMFLETVLACRERLYLSYVARDALSGEPLAPCSVVSELCDLLDGGYLGSGGTRRSHLRRFPLHRHDDASTRLPEATRERRALRLGEAMRGQLGEHAPSTVTELRSRVTPETLARLAPPLGLCLVESSTSPSPRRSPETLHLALSALRAFLECPLQGAAKAVLGLAEDEDAEDRAARVDEPFATPFLGVHALTAGAFYEALGRRASGRDVEGLLRDCYDERAVRLVRDGQLPSGPFGEAERTLHLAMLRAWWATLAPRIGGASVGKWHFGRAFEHEVVENLRAPIVLPAVPVDGRTVRVELHGATAPLCGDDASLVLQMRALGGGADAHRQALKVFRGFFDAVALSAAGHVGRHATLLCGYDRKERSAALQETMFRPIEQGEAEAYLAAAVADLFDGAHDYLLPIEAVYRHWTARTLDEPQTFAGCVEGLIDGDRGFSSDYGPVPEPRRRQIPDEARARQLIDRRHRLFLTRIVTTPDRTHEVVE